MAQGGDHSESLLTVNSGGQNWESVNGAGAYRVWIRKQELLTGDQKEPKGGNSRVASTNSRDSGRALIFPALGLVLD